MRRTPPPISICHHFWRTVDDGSVCRKESDTSNRVYSRISTLTVESSLLGIGSTRGRIESTVVELSLLEANRVYCGRIESTVVESKSSPISSTAIEPTSFESTPMKSATQIESTLLPEPNQIYHPNRIKSTPFESTPTESTPFQPTTQIVTSLPE